MPSPYQILIEARDNTGPATESAAANLNKVGEAAQSNSTRLKEAGANLAKDTGGIGDALAGTSREFRNLAFQGTLALDQIASGAGKTNSELAQLAHGASMVVTAFAFGSVVGAGIALAATGLEFLIQQLQAGAQKTEELKKQWVDFNTVLSDMGGKLDAAGTAIQSMLGISSQMAADFEKAAQASASFRTELSDLGAQATQMRVIGSEIGRLKEQLNIIQNTPQLAFLAPGIQAQITDLTNQLNGLTLGFQQDTQAAKDNAEAFNYDAAAADRLAQAIGDTRQQSIDAMRANSASVSTMNTDAWMQSHTFVPGVGWVDTATYQQKQADAKAAEQQAIADAKKLKDTIMGLIEGALKPTTVTPADLAATAAGTYKPKWDEFARQADAVAKGTDPNKYAGFAEKLKGLGKSAEQAAAGFRDFSLFADPKNLKLVDWGPVTVDVSHQIDIIIGKANLMNAAFDQVWSTLLTQNKIDLAKALGIDNVNAGNVDQFKSQIEKGIADPLGGANQQASDVKTTLDAINKTFTATVAVQKAKDFDDNLDQIIKDLDKIPSEADVVVTLTYQTLASAGTPAGGGGPTVTTGGGGGVHQQFGGTGVVPPGFPGDTFPVWLTSGERYIVEPNTQSTTHIAQALNQISSPTSQVGTFANQLAGSAGNAGGGASGFSDLFNKIMGGLSSLPAGFGPSYAGKDVDIAGFGHVTIPVSIFSMSASELASALLSASAGQLSSKEADLIVQRIMPLLTHQYARNANNLAAGGRA